jgi:tetratricopeptide (TPR) repeat protein
MSAAMDGAAAALSADSGSMLGLEPTSFSDESVVAEPEPMAPQEFAEIDLAAIPEATSERHSMPSDLALGGDLPFIDTERASSPVVRDLEVSTSRASGELAMIDTSVPGEAGFVMLDVEPTVLEEPPGPDLPMLDTSGDDVSRTDAASLVEIAPDAPTEFGDVSAVVDEPPPVRRASSLHAANSVMTLRIKVEDEPENWALRRQLGEALLEDGERDEGTRELEVALAGFDRANDLDSAASVVDEIVRINPGSVRFHQKRVEYAFRASDKNRTGEAYLALADALFRDGQAERARQVYHRVLELLPGDARAEAALETFGVAVPAPGTPPPRPARPARPTTTKSKRYTGAIESVASHTAEIAVPKPQGDEEFVSLGDWLREDEGPKSTRMVVAEEEPSGDEQADFADMLKKFKQGVAENVEEEDHESHYDLGVAFKEMGLLDEAIAQFQKALRGTQHRVRTYEALGQCFLEKKQLPVATTILQRALNEPGIGDEQLVGVLYLLGYIHESLGKPAEAKVFYERVFGVDIQFRDVGDRLNAVDKAAK